MTNIFTLNAHQAFDSSPVGGLAVSAPQTKEKFNAIKLNIALEQRGKLEEQFKHLAGAPPDMSQGRFWLQKPYKLLAVQAAAGESLNDLAKKHGVNIADVIHDNWQFDPQLQGDNKIDAQAGIRLDKNGLPEPLHRQITPNDRDPDAPLLPSEPIFIRDGSRVNHGVELQLDMDADPQENADMLNKAGYAAENAGLDFFEAHTSDFGVAVARLTQARDDAAAPLAVFRLSSHGTPGRIETPTQSVNIEDVAKQLIKKNLIGQGSKLVLDACQIAGTEEARAVLQNIADEYGIEIVASQTNALVGSAILPEAWTFKPHQSAIYVGDYLN